MRVAEIDDPALESSSLHQHGPIALAANLLDPAEGRVAQGRMDEDELGLALGRVVGCGNLG
ncbi:hypothetical protein V6C53_09775 [Desulfocurvibacter africanus]|uniref:hypothetical protein n=1 Tax=Desulfocurvibacter africanus TaxID=873 RepID=UPI002FDADBE9